MKTFEREEDCPLVERWIWDKIAVGYGYFEGVKELNENDLWQLKSTIDCQLQQMRDKGKAV